MAVYSGTPTVTRWWETGTRFGARAEVTKDLALTLSSQGGGTNTIGKAALGFATIYSVTFLRFTDSSGPTERALFVWTDGDYLYTGDPQDATDASRGEKADVSGTLYVRVTGTPA